MSFPVDEQYIWEAEARLRFRLPAPLRARLTRVNGGDVSANGETWMLHPVWDPSDRKRKSLTAAHIVWQTAEAKLWDEFPPEAIAIASDGYGNLLIVRPGVEEVERWDHATGELSPVEIDWG